MLAIEQPDRSSEQAAGDGPTEGSIDFTDTSVKKRRALQVSFLPNLEMDGKLTGNYNVPPDIYIAL